MKDVRSQQQHRSMDTCECPPLANNRHLFYLSSCESTTSLDTKDSNFSSTSLSSSSHTNLSTSVSDNLFLRVLQRLQTLTVRRQKHGRYRTLSSSLHMFFKMSHQSSTNIFFKSPSYPQLLNSSIENNETSSLGKHRRHQTVDTCTGSMRTIDRCHASRCFTMRQTERSTKTISEDNNTHTLSSLDLHAVSSTDSNLSSKYVPRLLSIDIQNVSQMLMSVFFLSFFGLSVDMYVIHFV
jgi:hypothetical protein